LGNKPRKKETNMSKNLTRKGLAFGALVALASTVIVGSPAQAAGEVTLVPTAGASYNVLLGSDFALNASLISSEPAGNITQLGYKVVNATNGTVTATADTGATGTDETLTITTVDGNKTTTAGFVPVIGANTLTISTAATATGSVTVTAFIDADGFEDLDGGEYQITRTINFVKPSEVTATTTFTKPVLGGNTFTANVVLSGDMNHEQIDAGDVTVEFFKSGVSIPDTDDNASSTGTVLTVAQRTNPVAAIYNSTDANLKAVLYAEADVLNADLNYTAYSITAGTFSAQANVEGVASGSAPVQVAAAATIDNITVKATQSADVKSTTTGVLDVDASTNTNGAATVRTTKASTIVATFLQADNKVVANESVVVTATGAGIAADTVTVNGNAVVDAAKTFTATTDATGKISVSIVGANVEATDSVTLSFALQGVTSSNYVVTWNDATYSVFNMSNSLDADVSLAVGGTLAVDYLVADQWGQGIAGDYRLNLTRSGSAGRTTAASWNYTPVLSSGRATFNIVDNGVGASSTGDTVAVAVEKALVGGGFTAQAITANAFDEFVINYVSAAAVASSVSAAATDTTPNVETVAIAALDRRYQVASAPGYADVTRVYGSVTRADGSAIPAAVVTVSASGLGFQAVVANGSGTGTPADLVFNSGSVTVIANAAGQYEVLVYSNTTGKKTVTVTSGSASKTVDLTFNPVTTGATALTVNAPTYIAPGRTLIVTAKAVDKFGNGVDVAVGEAKVTYTGPGLIVGNLPTDTDENGELSFRVLLGADEVGSANVIVKVSTDADATFDETGDLSVTKIVAIGEAPATPPTAKATGAKGLFYVAVASNETGRTVVVKVAGKTFKYLKGSTENKLYKVKAPRGTHKVTIFVANELILSKTVVVK
jgi:adhesin/invasin